MHSLFSSGTYGMSPYVMVDYLVRAMKINEFNYYRENSGFRYKRAPPRLIMMKPMEKPLVKGGSCPESDINACHLQRVLHGSCLLAKSKRPPSERFQMDKCNASMLLGQPVLDEAKQTLLLLNCLSCSTK